MKGRLIRSGFIVFVFTSFLLSCETIDMASRPAPLYLWADYEQQVYSYLDGEDLDVLLLQFLNTLRIMESSYKKIPPGFYAHMGLLYVETGQAEEAYSCFRAEKYLYPEAAPFMDFLLRRAEVETNDMVAEGAGE